MAPIKTGDESAFCEDQSEDVCLPSNNADGENKSNDITSVTQWPSCQRPDAEEKDINKRQDSVGDLLLTPQVVEDILGPEEDTQ